MAVVMTKPEHNYTSVGTVQPRPSELVQTSKPEACELWVCSERHIKVDLPAGAVAHAFLCTSTPL